MNILQELLKKIQQFQEDVQREVGAYSMDLHQLDMLLEEFTAPPDIDIPEVALLKKVRCFSVMNPVTVLIEIYCVGICKFGYLCVNLLELIFGLGLALASALLLVMSVRS